MFKFVLFTALLAFAFAKPLVVEYPVSYSAGLAYSSPVAYSYSTYGFDYDYPYAAYTYAAPYSYYEYLRR
ncbi:unnamed protein product [Chrysodeixis includens]|uniref:Uncharacterized protein n=1 Tax=Chrysodeixis includens TaxID=689277 RepID=A0A9P0BPS0_CHRIL|nr:unnamed protein product [Chrysodeixis includens]